MYAAYVTYLGASTNARPLTAPSAMAETPHGKRDLRRCGWFVRMLTTPASNAAPRVPVGREMWRGAGGEDAR
jgi:hypothetical protein